MNWKYEYEKTITTIFYIRAKSKYPEKCICPLDFKDVTKDICHSVDTCLECHHKYYPGNRELNLSWISTQYIHSFDYDNLGKCLQKSIPIPGKNQNINTITARRET